jgi:hypothetical protein
MSLDKTEEFSLLMIKWKDVQSIFQIYNKIKDQELPIYWNNQKEKTRPGIEISMIK